MIFSSSFSYIIIFFRYVNVIIRFICASNLQLSSPLSPNNFWLNFFDNVLYVDIQFSQSSEVNNSQNEQNPVKEPIWGEKPFHILLHTIRNFFISINQKIQSEKLQQC